MIKTDEAYKNLFAQKIIIQNFLEGFVKQGWVKNVDFSTLKSIPTEHISDKLDKRTNDYVWSVKINNSEVFILIMLEFQSEPDRLMPLRINNYKYLMYQHLIKNEYIDEKDLLPPVLPVVIYNGSPKWNYPVTMRSLIRDIDPDLRILAEDESFLLIETGTISKTKLDAQAMLENKNYVSRIFKLEQSKKNSDIIEIAAQINLWLKDSGNRELSKAIAVWFNKVLKAGKKDFENIPDFEEFSEVNSMLAETLNTLWNNAEEKGLKKGRFEGEQLGIAKGEQLGMAKGEQLKAKKTAKNMLQSGLSDEDISKFTELSFDQIKQIKKELN